MPPDSLTRYLLLPELRLLENRKSETGGVLLFAEKVSEFEVCPKCATPSASVYDHRWTKVKDDPIRGDDTVLHIKKRRFMCPTCKRPFTEPVPGIKKDYRTTGRYRKRLLWACENFGDLKSVRRNYRCSSGLLQRVLYEQLELRRRTRLYPWPTRIGIDEHLFKHEPRLNLRRFVTMVVDHKNKRLMEVVHGKSGDELRAALDYIPGRENVQWVALDMSDSYRRFARDFFPNARLVADKFHVLRLVTPAIHRYLEALGLGREALPLYRVLRRNPLKLSAEWCWRLPRKCPSRGHSSMRYPTWSDTFTPLRARSIRPFAVGVRPQGPQIRSTAQKSPACACSAVSFRLGQLLAPDHRAHFASRTRDLEHGGTLRTLR